jgi:hypothetical protein
MPVRSDCVRGWFFGSPLQEIIGESQWQSGEPKIFGGAMRSPLQGSRSVGWAFLGLHPRLLWGRAFGPAWGWSPNFVSSRFFAMGVPGASPQAFMGAGLWPCMGLVTQLCFVSLLCEWAFLGLHPRLLLRRAFGPSWGWSPNHDSSRFFAMGIPGALPQALNASGLWPFMGLVTQLCFVSLLCEWTSWGVTPGFKCVGPLALHGAGDPIMFRLASLRMDFLGLHPRLLWGRAFGPSWGW